VGVGVFRVVLLLVPPFAVFHAAPVHLSGYFILEIFVKFLEVQLVSAERLGRHIAVIGTRQCGLSHV
jgi:hypothetical protein